MEDDLETVPVHTAAFVAGLNIGKLVRSFKTEPAPDVEVVVPVQVGTFVLGTEDPNAFHARNFQFLAHPASDIFVGGDGDLFVEKTVVEPVYATDQALFKAFSLTARKWRPTRGQFRPDAGKKTVPMETTGAVPIRQNSHLTSGFEWGGGGEENAVSHDVGSPNLR
jgi:hypothetical protein